MPEKATPWANGVQSTIAQEEKGEASDGAKMRSREFCDCRHDLATALQIRSANPMNARGSPDS